MLHCDIPCSHIYSITNKFPKIPETISLKLTKNLNGLNFSYEKIITPVATLDFSLEQKLKCKAVKAIKKYSHFKNEKVIREAVSSFAINDQFANGMPTAFHEVVSNGISKFSAKKKPLQQTSNGIANDNDLTKV